LKPLPTTRDPHLPCLSSSLSSSFLSPFDASSHLRRLQLPFVLICCNNSTLLVLTLFPLTLRTSSYILPVYILLVAFVPHSRFRFPVLHARHRYQHIYLNLSASVVPPVSVSSIVPSRTKPSRLQAARHSLSSLCSSALVCNIVRSDPEYIHS